MFSGCTGLTVAPELPATTLAENCYYLMFSNCTGLVSVPCLPAPVLVEGCYGFMFNMCTSLKYVKCLATDISATDCTDWWFYSVPAGGTFVKAAGMDGWPTGISGIPSGWIVKEVE